MGKVRHIEMAELWIKDANERQEIEQNAADVLIKPVHQETWIRHVETLKCRVVPPDSHPRGAGSECVCVWTCIHLSRVHSTTMVSSLVKQSHGAARPQRVRLVCNESEREPGPCAALVQRASKEHLLP